MNICHQLGRLTDNAVFKEVKPGMFIVNFRLAVEKIMKTKDGEEKKKVNFIDCVAWGKNAQAGKNMVKGQQVFCSGELEYETWGTPEAPRSKHVLLCTALVHDFSLSREIVEPPVEPVGKQERRPAQPAQAIAQPQKPGSYLDDLPF